ncbi:MAG: alpha-amylase family protein, partial [Treponema sp.]|nr:alpha-amylase family protein [Treponema sp.]
PEEFWREVVDRCAVEAPHTLLLAEAFWMMEGYFVRTLGMHRVYNSAFMNMLKNEENDKYRSTIKNTLEFDPEVLKRFVNFMNNPDEETAVAQFGKGDKYFGICTLLVTMPGLPMFGHGQIEGFEEKYGMEYRRSYRDEKPDQYLVDRHEREIFPLMKKRHIFSGSAGFCLYDFFGPDGKVNENVFAYSNRAGDERALIFYNNCFTRASGWIRRGAVAIPQKDGTYRQDSLCEAFGLHGESRFFTLLREQRSGLWYIRSSKEIAERGLYAGLNGYEAQVFLDIQEKEDTIDARPGTWESRWAMLNYELNGRGVKNPEEAAVDIALKELYDPVREILSPGRLKDLAFFFGTGGDDVDHAALVESWHEPVNAFVAAAKKFLSGGDGRYEPWKVQRPVPALNAADTSRVNASMMEAAGSAAQGEWKKWSEYLENLLALADPEPEGKKADAFLKGLGEKIAARPVLALMALAYNTLGLLKSIAALAEPTAAAEAAEPAVAAAADLALHWQLDRLMRECWESAGLAHNEAQRGAEIALALLGRSDSKILPADIKMPAADLPGAEMPGVLGAAIILENYDAADFRKILGVNRFEDVTWFNKEAFEQTLLLVPLFILPEEYRPVDGQQATDKARVKRIKTIAAVTEAFRRAEEASGYRLDELPVLLSGGEKRPSGQAEGSAHGGGKGSRKKKTRASASSKSRKKK